MDTIQNTKENILTKAIKDTAWLEDAKWSQADADWLDLSAAIALKILRFLREHKMTQKELADQLGFSPQYINKIVKGSENLTLETICKIQKVLRIRLIEIADSNTELEIMPEPTEEEVTA
jgi:DNA-binding XRE family transcriptional regulator